MTAERNSRPVAGRVRREPCARQRAPPAPRLAAAPRRLRRDEAADRLLTSESTTAYYATSVLVTDSFRQLGEHQAQWWEHRFGKKRRVAQHQSCKRGLAETKESSGYKKPLGIAKWFIMV